MSNKRDGKEDNKQYLLIYKYNHKHIDSFFLFLNRYLKRIIINGSYVKFVVDLNTINEPSTHSDTYTKVLFFLSYPIGNKALYSFKELSNRLFIFYCVLSSSIILYCYNKTLQSILLILQQQKKTLRLNGNRNRIKLSKKK